MTTKDYQKVVDWLFVQTPNYQIDGEKPTNQDLATLKNCVIFSGIHKIKIKTIHIGVTNGKRSTSNMLASVLQESGYKIGLYNSPHLIDFTERIKINGKIVTNNLFTISSKN